MEEKYVLIDVYGNKVICNCTYSSLDRAKEDLSIEFQCFTSDDNDIEYGKDCWIADDEMSAWAILNGKDRVWTIVKVLR
jgi:hypothetical protein